jgi:hypothetical protein
MRWLPLLALLATCGGGQPSTADAGARIECDPSAQGCPTGQTCDLICDELGSKLGCRPVGTVALNAACTLTETCAARSGCFATGSTPQSCVQYCQTDADCAQGICRERQVLRNCPGARALYMLKFCLP